MEGDSCRQRKESFLQILQTIDAEDVFLPISQTLVFHTDDDYQTIIDVVQKHDNLYYPVYDARIDDIVGVLCVKDLLFVSQENFALKDIIKTPYFISENLKIADLYLNLEDKDIDFAIVVDEHGAVRGVITHAEIRAALIGEHYIEHDHIIPKIGSEYIVDAKIALEEFNQHFNLNLECEDCDTIGGFVIEQFTYVPEENEVLTLNNVIITVKKIEGAKLLELGITLQ